MSDVVIRVEHLSKQYPVGHCQNTGAQSLREALTDTLNAPLRRLKNHFQPSHAIAVSDDTFWALQDVSFDIKQGEVVGIIGRNGSGKSTLLKILARITEPTQGKAVLCGRVGSLLEVGTGFHPELTGRENVYLNGAILGMKRREIEQHFDAIVDFSGVERFLDTAVKHYSSGMRMRLAFAVAAHLDPEILLVDEVLSVGDAEFRKKCLGKMHDEAQCGRTIVVVSHNMNLMAELCQRILYLKDGQLLKDSDSKTSIATYMTTIEQQAIPLAERTDRTGNGQVRLTGMRWLDADTLMPLDTVISGQTVYLEVSYAATPDYQQPLDHLEVHLGIRNQLDQYIFGLGSRMASNAFDQRLPAEGRLYCHIERLPLSPGRYFCNGTLKLKGELADSIQRACVIEVEAGDFFGIGISSASPSQGIYVPQRWQDELP